MKDPYLILGLLEDETSDTTVSPVDDNMVKEAYLKLIRAFPPEQEPQRFQEIRKAYEQLETLHKRLEYELFDLTLPDQQDLVTALLPVSSLKRPPLKQMQRLLALQ